MTAFSLNLDLERVNSNIECPLYILNMKGLKKFTFDTFRVFELEMRTRIFDINFWDTLYKFKIL